MSESSPHLNFKCSKKFESMEPNQDGRFCAACNKTVKDFRGLNQQDIENRILSDNSQEPCGNFYAYQLSNPYGNWKDKLITLYQRFNRNQNRFGILRPICLFFISSLLIITGCKSRQLAGAYAYGFSGSEGNEKYKKEIKKEKSDTQIKTH